MMKHYYDHESASWINVVKGQKHFFRNLLELLARRHEVNVLRRQQPGRARLLPVCGELLISPESATPHTRAGESTI